MLPDDRVCYRRVAELPGVLPDEQAFYWSETRQLDLEIEPGNSGTRTRTSTRTLTRQLELEVEPLPARYRTTGCAENDRTTRYAARGSGRRDAADARMCYRMTECGTGVLWCEVCDVSMGTSAAPARDARQPCARSDTSMGTSARNGAAE